MKKWIIIAGAALFALSAGGVAAQQSVPRRSHYVLINETRSHEFDLAYKMSLKLAEKKSGIENALVLLPALPASKTIEETATSLFAHLRIGERSHGRGILYVYAVKENLMKIEVSYALEGEIPDAVCRRLEEAAKTYMLSEMPQDFVTELIITTNLRGMGSKREAGDVSRPKWLNAEFLSGGAGAHDTGYRRTLDDYQRAIRRLPDASLEQFAPSTDAAESVRRYLASLEAGIGDPRLPLLTEGSRVFRAVVPRNDAQQQRIYEYFTSGGAYRLIFSGGLGLAVPPADKSNLPIVLRLGSDSLWYVDEAKAWTYFHRFEDSEGFYVKYADNPFFAELRARNPKMGRAIYDNHARTPPLPAYPFSLAAAVHAGEAAIGANPRTAANYAALGDLYLFEMDWLAPAIELYEKAVALAPGELSYRWRLMDVYLVSSRADKMLAELKYLAERLPGDKATREWYREYKKAYDFDNN
jgi:hypothetical protein